MNEQPDMAIDLTDDKQKKPTKKQDDIPAEPVKEFGGRDGPEPTRYGDWEKRGIISDF